MKIRIVLFLLFCVTASGLVVLFYSANTPPSKEELISSFRLKRDAFERLRAMLVADEQISRIADWGIQTTTSLVVYIPPKGNFPLARYTAYLKLLKEAGGIAASRTVGTEPDTCILIWASGWAADTKHIAICWLGREPVQSENISGRRNFSFQHIDGNWYLQSDS